MKKEKIYHYDDESDYIESILFPDVENDDDDGWGSILGGD